MHKDANTGKLGVVGVFMEASAGATPNPCLEVALQFAPTIPKTSEAIKGKCVASQVS